MARTVRDAKLGSREGRLKLEAGKRHWRGIHKGLALGYRRGKQGSGSWIVRLLEPGDTYRLLTLGAADDYTEANGHDVLDFQQAQHAALEKAEEAKRNQGVLPRNKETVADAAKAYMEWFRNHKKSVKETQYTIDVHILPKLGDIPLNALTTTKIEEWRDKLASAPARLRTSKFAKAVKHRAGPKTPEEMKARKSSANRVLTVLKALLNYAFNKGLVADDTPWRGGAVEPFKKVDEARIRYLEGDEASKLLNACPPDLRQLVQGALLTGMRYGELRQLKVRDVSPSRVYVAESKSGKPRHIPLNPEGRALFAALCANKKADDLVFVRESGKPWGDSHQTRPLRLAYEAAGIAPVSFHELRHSYASALVNAGVSIKLVAELLGHVNTRMTEKHYTHINNKALTDAVATLPSSFGYTEKETV